MRRGEKFYYALRNHDTTADVDYSIYISNTNIKLAQQIAMRDYLTDAYKNLLMHLAAVQTLLSFEREDKVDGCYTKLVEGRKHLISPLVGTPQQKIDAWRQEEYVQNTQYPENLVHETERGERVRSKSEEMIANYLYSMKDYIDYKYERPLVLRVNGKNETIYPDFTIINLRTGDKFILEHVSRLDASGYHDKFVWKHNAYLMNGFVQKGKVLYSFESEGQPFTLKYVKKLVQDTVLM